MRLLAVFFVLFVPLCVNAEETSNTETVKNIPYYTDEAIKAENDPYQKERCFLDLCYPKDSKGFATLIWFHGGGLSGGSKYLPPAYMQTDLYKKGKLAIIAVNYRLGPKAEYPKYIKDAAASFAWTYRNIAKYGGDPSKIFVSGGSAGGYLTMMIGMDPQWLAPYGIGLDKIAGLLPVSGQATSHFNVKKWIGTPGKRYAPVIDKTAPLFFVSKDLSPIYLILGDRKSGKEIPCRVEENELLYSALKALNHPFVMFSESPGMGHGIASMGKDTPDKVIKNIDEFFAKAVKEQ